MTVNLLDDDEVLNLLSSQEEDVLHPNKKARKGASSLEQAAGGPGAADPSRLASVLGNLGGGAGKAAAGAAGGGATAKVAAAAVIAPEDRQRMEQMQRLRAEFEKADRLSDDEDNVENVPVETHRFRVPRYHSLGRPMPSVQGAHMPASGSAAGAGGQAGVSGSSAGAAEAPGTAPAAAGGPAGAAQQESAEPKMTVTCQSRDGRVKLRLKLCDPLSKLVTAFAKHWQEKGQAMPEATSAYTLKFDDEKLDHSATLGDIKEEYDLADEDIIDITWKA